MYVGVFVMGTLAEIKPPRLCEHVCLWSKAIILCFQKASHLLSKGGELIHQAAATVLQIISMQTRAQLPGYTLQSPQNRSGYFSWKNYCTM